MSSPSHVQNGRIIFNSIPTGYPVPGETTVYEETEIDLNQPLNGGFLVKLLVLSIDPYLRGRMRDPSIKSYSTPFTLGQPIVNFGVGIVLRSENDKVKVGDHLYGRFDFENYVVKNDPSQFKVLKKEENLPWSVYVGAAGMPGQTAYVAWKLFSKAKKGETVYVSTAAGPVGATVVQLAKADGLKVIGSAGSDEKVEFLRSIGVDVAFNYKKTDTLKVLKENGGIDIYWDNVGGPQLEAAIEAGHKFLRVINCGAISAYNGSGSYHIKNLGLIFGKSISLNGFIVGDYPELVQESYSYLPKKLASGEFKYKEHVYNGLEKASQAITDVQKGDNTGKAVIVL